MMYNPYISWTKLVFHPPMQETARVSPGIDALGLRSLSGSFGGVGKAGCSPLWKNSKAWGGVSSEALAKAGASAGSAEGIKDTPCVCPGRLHYGLKAAGKKESGPSFQIDRTYGVYFYLRWRSARLPR
jgi:hypothetical protein